MNRLVVLMAVVLVFLFLYSWYLPENHSSQLLLDLSTDNSHPGILVSDSLQIQQSFTLQKNGNSIVIPLQAKNYVGAGVLHLRLTRTDTQTDIFIDQAEIKNNRQGNIRFDLKHAVLIPEVPYSAILSFSNVQEQDSIRISSAFGKYANLSGTVNQYRLQKNSIWKQIDTRHGNIAMQFYKSPQQNNLVLTLKTFTLPALVFAVLFAWCIVVCKKETYKKIHFYIPDWKEYGIVAGIGLLLACIATIPLYIHPTYISNHGDVNRGLIYAAIAQRDILLGHLPQWNQYICGGSPLWGDLESWFLQPLFLLTIPFSAVIAMKLMYTLCLAIACTGFYALARHVLKLRIIGSAIFALIMAFGGYISGHLTEGYYVWIASTWIPWFLLFAILSLKNIRWVGLAGLMMAFMFGSGSMHLAVYCLLFIAILFLFPIENTKISRRYSTLFLVICFFVVLSAAKLLPSFSLLTANISREGFVPSLLELPSILLGRGVLPPLMDNGQVIRWGEFDTYIGYGSLALACIGGFIWRKEVWNTYKAYIVASIAMLCFSFILLPITHGFLSHITDLFRMPSRMLLFGVFWIALLVGYGADRGFRFKPGITLLLLILIAVDLLSNDITLFSRTFTVALPELHRETTFQRVAHAYTTDDEAYYRAVYIDFLENRGTNDVCRFYQSEPFSRAIDSTDPRSMFTGEVALQNSDAGTVVSTMNDQSEYTIHANTASATTIIINQNYYPGWKTDSKLEVQNIEGRIGIPIPAGVYDFSLRYSPNTVYWGMIISMIGIVLGVLLLLV